MAEPERAPWTGLRLAEPAMGTVFSFTVRTPATTAIRAAAAEAVAWLHHVDAVFSTYRPDSAVSRLDRGAAALSDCPPVVAEVLELCTAAERATGGWFSTVATGRLDPSGLVKGWAVDRASDLLHAAGAVDTCLNGGGDIRFRGEAGPGRPWRTGIADPSAPGRLAAVVEAGAAAVATSGTAERGAHITDPFTGRPADAGWVLSATVVGPELTWADVYATAAFAMGPDRALEWIEGVGGYELLLVGADRMRASAGMPLVGHRDRPYPRTGG